MKLLDKTLAGYLRIFLIDILGDDLILHKTKTKAISHYEWQYRKPLIFKRRWKKENRDCYLQGSCMNSVFVCKTSRIDRLRNLFFQVNSGKINFEPFPFEHYVEGRKKADIINYNAFMLDFDLKLENNEHYKGEKLTSAKEKLYETICDKLPLEPDYIIESRNGFHVYYLIPPNDRNMCSEYWHKVECGIFDYVKKNVSDCVDHAVKKSNQIMRLPYSLHRKDDDTDDFVVYIRHQRNEKLKAELVSEGDYSSAQFAYSLTEIIKSFNINEKILPSQSKEETQEEKQQKIDKKNLSSVRKKYPAIDALFRCDTNFFRYLQRKSPKYSMSYSEAIEYIKSVDMRFFLNIPNQPLKVVFSSLFYPDIHPSDYFFTNPQKGTTSYYCRRDKKWYNNIFDIVYRLIEMSVKNISPKENWRCTFKLLCLIFDLNVVKNWKNFFNRVIENNLKQFRKIITHSKQTKYLKCATDLYHELMKAWKEHVYKNNIDFRTAHRTVAAGWIGKKIHTARSTIQKELLLLEYVGLIKKIDSSYKKYGYFANEYQFTIVTDENVSEIISKTEVIKMSMDKPLKQASREKLKWLF